MARAAIRYDSAHRDLIYLLISLFFFFFIITIANLFVERGGKVALAAMVPVVVVSLRILRSVSHAVVTKSRVDPKPITRYSIC